MADDKPDVHEDEHERGYERVLERILDRVMRGDHDREQHPIVWPVGMIPIKSDWKPHAFYGDQDSAFKCYGCGLSMGDHRMRQAEWEEEQR